MQKRILLSVYRVLELVFNCYLSVLFYVVVFSRLVSEGTIKLSIFQYNVFLLQIIYVHCKGHVIYLPLSPKSYVNLGWDFVMICHTQYILCIKVCMVQKVYQLPIGVIAYLLPVQRTNPFGYPGPTWNIISWLLQHVDSNDRTVAPNLSDNMKCRKTTKHVDKIISFATTKEGKPGTMSELQNHKPHQTPKQDSTMHNPKHTEP